MKNNLYMNSIHIVMTWISVIVFVILPSLVHAQQSNTLFFLENAPMRHTINPAFQPISDGFVNFSPLGWMQAGGGNTSLTVSDIIYVDPQTGQTITSLHPNGNKKQLLRLMRNMTLVSGDLTLGLVNVGFRIKDKGFIMIGINERIDLGVSIPKSLPQFLLGGGMNDLDGGVNKFNLSRLGVGANMYTEISAGYSHQLDEKWTIGGKLKVLLGHANMGMTTRNLTLDADIEQWVMKGNMQLEISGPINYGALPQIEGQTLNEIIENINSDPIAMDQLIDIRNIGQLVKPNGYGAAFDIGFVYKPIENIRISAALNDFGLIYWANSQRYTCSLDTTFVGVGEFEYGDPAFHDVEGNFSTQLLLDSALQSLVGLGNALSMKKSGSGYAKMVSAKLNIGIDASFWNNRINVGLLSATRLYNARLYEEITLGIGFKPCNWFNIAASYSLMHNGKFSNIGAGLSFMPYDGVNLTLAMDYIPTTYAGLDIGTAKPLYILPTKTKMVNLALGFSICWGTNKKKVAVVEE